MDKIEVLKKISKDGSLENFLEYNDDEEIVLVSIARDPNSLRYASDRLKASKQIVLLAVSNDGRAIKYASNDLKDDKEVVLAALRGKKKYVCASEILCYASERLRDDDEVVDTAISYYGYYALRYASERKQFDSEKIKSWLDLELRNSNCECDLVEIIMNALNVANEARGYIQKEVIKEGTQKVLAKVPNKNDYNS